MPPIVSTKTCMFSVCCIGNIFMVLKKRFWKKKNHHILRVNINLLKTFRSASSKKKSKTLEIVSRVL